MPASRPWPWVPAALWAALIFACSSIPNLGAELGTPGLVGLTLAHAGVYAVHGLLLARVARRATLAIGLAAAYAVTDEIHQSSVEGRRGSPLDAIADGVGVACGAHPWSTRRLGVRT